MNNLPSLLEQSIPPCSLSQGQALFLDSSIAGQVDGRLGRDGLSLKHFVLMLRTLPDKSPRLYTPDVDAHTDHPNLTRLILRALAVNDITAGAIRA